MPLYLQLGEPGVTNGEDFEITIPELRGLRWSSQDMVQDAIRDRLLTIQRRALFWESDPPDSEDESDPPDTKTVVSSIEETFEDACDGSPVVFDMREMEPALQRALVRSVLGSIEGVCEAETTKGTGRYPFVFFEEAHFYIDESAIINVITRGRHIGMASMFVTNTPQKLPDTVFRQLDNLFLLSLTHKDDIRNVSRNSFTDEATTESFATRMPARHAMVVGNVTDRYPRRCWFIHSQRECLQLDGLGLPGTASSGSRVRAILIGTTQRKAVATIVDGEKSTTQRQLHKLHQKMQQRYCLSEGTPALRDAMSFKTNLFLACPSMVQVQGELWSRSHYRPRDQLQGARGWLTCIR